MPELPEVETVRRGLSEVLVGRVIEGIAIRRHDLRIPIPRQLDKRVIGRRLIEIGRRGKYLLFYLSDGVIVIMHLGMSGRMVISSNDELSKHDHVVLTFGAGLKVKFNDPRRFGCVDVTTEEELPRHRLLCNLGIEPLTAQFTEEAMSCGLQGRKAPIKNLLLDQTIVAGLGNIYVCESLFLARISPRRAGQNVKGVRLLRLVTSVRKVLLAAIQAGGSSLRDYVQASGESGYFQHRFSVYGREGQPCPSGNPGHVVDRLVQANRSTFYCSACQR